MRQSAPNIRKMGVVGYSQFNRENYGSTIAYLGQPYRCIASRVSTREAGIEAILAEGLQAYAGASDPHVFNLTPGDFAPTTSVVPPDARSLLVWHGRSYTVSRSSYDDVGETRGLLVYAFRTLLAPGNTPDGLPAGSGIFPATTATLYTPKGRVQNINGQYNLTDTSYVSQGAVTVFIEPSAAMERMSPFGAQDLRTQRIFTLQALPQFAIVRDANGAWLALTASEQFPMTGDFRVMGQRLAVLPPGVV